MITLTENAATQLRLLLEEKRAQNKSGLRIRVDKGGCAGWQYTMMIDSVEPNDHTFCHHGVSVIVDPDSLVFLNDSQIDYVEALNDSGFRVINPNSARNCGCGTSFEPKTS